MIKHVIGSFVAIVISIANVFAAPKTINPLDFGLDRARTGVECYEALFRCHQEAVKKGYAVSYQGVGNIDIEIPQNGISIPLPTYTDFDGVEMTVRTTGKSKFLFSMTQQTKGLSVKGEYIDKGDFRIIPSLKKGNYLLIVSDETKWVNNRKDYDYGATRRDIFYVKNGKSRQRPISSYQTKTSKPVAYFCEVITDKKVIKNLRIVRANDSPAKVFCIQINNQYNVELNNITIVTPEDDKNYGDAAIQLLNCVDVTMDDITINGTYSQSRAYGYGVNADNVNGLLVNRMYARAKWGVWGTNNMCNVVLKECDINRFDIHCYGRDIKAVDCKFSGLYNQLSSVYGTVLFYGCTFTDFIPLLIESSYNAFTPFDLIWKKCTFHLGEKTNYLMTLFGVPEPYNERQELRRKCLPNITVKNCEIILDDDVKQWYLIHTGGIKYKDSFDYVSNIKMRNVKVIGNRDAEFELSTEPLKTTHKLKTNIKIKS